MSQNNMILFCHDFVGLSVTLFGRVVQKNLVEYQRPLEELIGYALHSPSLH